MSFKKLILPSMGMISQKYFRFWFEDYHHLDGRLRFIFYLGMLFMLLNFGGGLLHVDFYMQNVPDWLIFPRGLADLLYFSSTPLVIIKAIEFLIPLALILSAIGFFGWIPPLFSGLGLFFLHGLAIGYIGIDHRWYVPVLTLLVLCFSSSSTDKWSLDYYLRTKYSRYPFGKTSRSIQKYSSFALKLLLIIVSLIYFSSGLSKLNESGLAWMEGKALQEFLTTSYSRFPSITKWFQENQDISIWASVLSLLLECGSILVIFFKSLRNIFIFSWIVFHVFIYLVMLPAYWPQIWCLSLLFYKKNLVDTPTGSKLSRSEKRLEVIGTGVFILLLLVAILRVEWWPFTHIPMYSSNLDSYAQSHDVTLTRDSITEINKATYYAKLCQKTWYTTCPWGVWKQFSKLITIQVVGESGKKNIRYLPKLRSFRLLPPKNMGTKNTKIGMKFLACDEVGFPKIGDCKSSKYLEKMAQYLVRELPHLKRQYHLLQIVYNKNLILKSVPLK